MNLKARNSGDENPERVVEIWAEQDGDEIVIRMKDSGSCLPEGELGLLSISERDGKIEMIAWDGLEDTCIGADSIKDIIE